MLANCNLSIQKRSHEFSTENTLFEFLNAQDQTRAPTTMKVIAVLLLGSLSLAAAFVKQPASSSRATTDLSAMKKKMGNGKVCILTTRELARYMYQYRERCLTARCSLYLR